MALRQSHRVGWLEQNSKLDVLGVSDAFGRFRTIFAVWSVFSRFGMFFDVFGRFWSVSDLGFGFGNNPRRQVHSRQVVKNHENPTRVSIFLKSDQKFKVKSKVKSKVKPNLFSSHFTVTLFFEIVIKRKFKRKRKQKRKRGSLREGREAPPRRCPPPLRFCFRFCLNLRLI